MAENRRPTTPRSSAQIANPATTPLNTVGRRPSNDANTTPQPSDIATCDNEPAASNRQFEDRSSTNNVPTAAVDLSGLSRCAIDHTVEGTPLIAPAIAPATNPSVIKECDRLNESSD